MKLKQIALAALAATFITGAPVAAFAESGVGIGSGANGGQTSAVMEQNWRNNHGFAAPIYGYAGTTYGYARPQGHIVKKQVRANTQMKHSG